MGEKPLVLVADDCVDQLHTYGNLLEHHGYRVDTATSAGKAKAKLREKHHIYSAVLCDYKFGDSQNGLDVLLTRNKLDKNLPFVVLSGMVQSREAVDLARAGADWFLEKPCNPDLLLETLGNILQREYRFRKPVVVLKSGGSSQDKDLFEKPSKHFGYFLDTVLALQDKFQVILATGLGPFGQTIKEREEKYGPFKNSERLKNDALRLSKELLLEQLSKNGDYAISLEPDDLTGRSYVQRRLEEQQQLPRGVAVPSLESIVGDEDKSIVVGRAPRQFGLERPGMKLTPFQQMKDSDLQTLYWAEFFGAERIIFVKDTDCIYTYDPLLGKNKGLIPWILAQRHNERREVAYVSEFLKGEISRIGADDGQDDHLAETAMLEAMLYSPSVRSLHIVPVDPLGFHIGQWHVVTGMRSYTGSCSIRAFRSYTGREDRPTPKQPLDFIEAYLDERREVKQKKSFEMFNNLLERAIQGHPPFIMRDGCYSLSQGSQVAWS